MSGLEKRVTGDDRAIHGMSFPQFTPAVHLKFLIVTSIEDFEHLLSDEALTFGSNVEAPRKVLLDDKADSFLLSAVRPLRNEQFAIVGINKWCELEKITSDIAFAVNFAYTDFSTRMTGSSPYSAETCLVLKEITKALMQDFIVQTNAELFRDGPTSGNRRVFGTNIFGHPMREVPSKPGTFEVARWPSEVTKVIREDAAGKGRSPYENMIRETFLTNGFEIKENQTDLKPYVYAAATELLKRHQMELDTNQVARVVRSIRDFAQFGVLSLRNAWNSNAKELYTTPINPEIAVAILRASFPWRDDVEGWYAYRDFVAENWPVDNPNKDRELAGLLGVNPSPIWHAV